MTEFGSPCHLPQSHDQPAMLAYRVADRVALAGQPQPDDWQRLAQAGFQVVLNIRSDPQRAAIQAQAAQAAGLRYVYMPLPAYELEAAHLAEFSAFVEQASAEKTLIHCRSATRVGLLWMLHRIMRQGLSLEQAQTELRAAGYDDDMLDGLTFCAEDYFERAGLSVAFDE